MASQPKPASSLADFWKSNFRRVPEDMEWTHVLLLGCSFITSTKCWSYHSSNHTMSWDKARQWCKYYYNDIVIIRNLQENNYVASHLPDRQSSPYYWIGIVRRNTNQTWTWVGNNSTWIDQNLWAANEPNNWSTDVCVEIYVSDNKNRGKWNDEQCGMAKYAACYEAQCKTNSCAQGKCLEVPGTINCLCDDGFEGERCQTEVKCQPLTPSDGSVICDRKNNSINSTCRFQCHAGFLILGVPEVTCGINGTWSGPRPLCASKVIQLHENIPLLVVYPLRLQARSHCSVGVGRCQCLLLHQLLLEKTQEKKDSGLCKKN